MDLLVGKTFADRYLIEARLGAGAMGAVYRARHVKIGKSFAVKVLHPELLADAKLRRRFDREAELAGTLKHPNIVGVVDVGEAEGMRYLVMELAVGEPLSELIARGPMPAERAVPILRQLCDALHHAHARGLVHRDFKPDNVIVERRSDGTDFIRIIDFGIAILREELASDLDRLTTDGVVLGTPHYLAPEQAYGHGDHRIDLFALGVVSYEMLTGKLPFDGEGAEIARANMTMATPAMGVRVPFLEVDPLLEAFTRRLMNKSPELRPESGKEAGELLDLIQHDRIAAGELLGLDRETNTRWMIGSTDESRPVARVAIGDTDESPPLEATPVARAHSVVTTPPPRARRRWLLGGAAVVAIGLGSGIVAIGGSRSEMSGDPQARLQSSTRDDELGIRKPAAAPTTPSPDAEVVAPDAAISEAAVVETAVVDAAIVDPLPPRPAIVPRATPVPPRPVRPKPPLPPPPAVPVEPTAQQLAELYIAVGNQLKAYADRKGARAEVLSARYRLIKINHAMGSGDRRRVAAAELAELRAQLARKD